MFSEKENIVQSGVHKFAQPASCLWSDLGFCNSRHMSFFSTVFGSGPSADPHYVISLFSGL